MVLITCKQGLQHVGDQLGSAPPPRRVAEGTPHRGSSPGQAACPLEIFQSQALCYGGFLSLLFLIYDTVPILLSDTM